MRDSTEDVVVEKERERERDCSYRRRYGIFFDSHLRLFLPTFLLGVSKPASLICYCDACVAGSVGVC